MDDLISRHGVLRRMNSVMDIPDVYYLPIHFKEWVIDEMPTIEERKKGKWIETGANYECPFCHNEFDYISTRMGNRWCFCPMCGADMRGEDDEAD